MLVYRRFLSGDAPMSRITEGLIVTAALGLALWPVTSRAETKAGVAQTVQNHVFSIMRGNQEPLTVGKEVYMDQSVRTEDDSETQLLLLDQTNFKIGPKSNVVLDRFVFDPNKPKGDVIINVTQGVFRFVTGSQDPSSYHIKTPVATMGVRGTVVEMNSVIEPNGKPKLEIHLVKGAVDVTITNPSSPEFAFVSLEKDDLLLTISDGKYKTNSWVAQNSLYEARAGGDVTGALGAAGAGAGAGGQTNPTPRSGFINTGSGSGGGGSGGGGGNPVFTFTPTTASTAVSP
jgi:uncharacterized membrane protein YgcG